MQRLAQATALLALAAFAVAGCGGDGDGGGSTTGGGGDATSGSTTTGGSTTSSTSTGSSSGAGGTPECGPDGPAPDEVVSTSGDPEGGMFTLDEALADLPQGPGPLRAVIETEMGQLTCELFPDDAPIGVANFVGLARGRRPWREPGTANWLKRPFYDGLTFHRVIDNFMAQGGNPLGTGYGGPGYSFANEIAGLTHVPGTLAYANAGADTNGSQFYITEGAEPGLDADYVIFGLCEPIAVVEALTAVATSGPPSDKPLEDIHTISVAITRCAP